jgi:hypothetical protein
MIGPGTGVRVYLACGATDMRKGSPVWPRSARTSYARTRRAARSSRSVGAGEIG